MKAFTLLALCAATLLGACASNPNSIAPVSMGNAFADVSCQDAVTMLNQERASLAVLESRQRDAMAADAIGVFLILIPMGSVSGNDVEGEIAAAKGKVLALETRLATCNTVAG